MQTEGTWINVSIHCRILFGQEPLMSVVLHHKLWRVIKFEEDDITVAYRGLGATKRMHHAADTAEMLGTRK